MIKVILKDGSTMEIQEGTSILEVAKRISEGLARNVTCGEINGEIRDIRYKIKEDCNLILHTFKNDDLEGKKAYWHTTSHIMAQAVKRLFPNVKFAIGPSIDEGFYYDFDVENPFTDEDKKNGFSHLRPQKVIDKSAFGSASFAAEAIYSAVCLISTGLSIFALVQAVIQGAEHSAQFFTKAFAPFKLSKRSERINLSGCAPYGQAFVQGASRHKRQRALSSIAVFFTNGISISPFPLCCYRYRGDIALPCYVSLLFIISYRLSFSL